jgi:hypothetical protein
MHPTDHAHFIHLINRLPLCDLILEPFSATVADAFCYYATLGRKEGASALRSVAMPIRRRTSQLHVSNHGFMILFLYIIGRAFGLHGITGLEAH